MNTQTQIVNKIILIIDDDVSLTYLLKKKIERIGYTVLCANSSAEAIEILQKQKFDLVFIDYLLHNVTAFDLLADAKNAGLEFPYIIMTGNSDVQVAVSMMKHGAIDYLIKDRKLIYALPAVLERVFHQIETENNLNKAQKALLESETRYGELFDNAHDLIYTIDLQGNFISYNKTAARVVGFMPDPSGKQPNMKDFLDDDQYQMAFSKIQYKIKEGSPYTQYEVVLNCVNGKKINLEVNSYLKLKDGKPHEIFGIARDITERKKTEKTIKENKANLEIALQSAEMGVWSLNLETNIRQFDKQSCNLLGIVFENFTGLPEQFFNCVHPDDIINIQTALQRSIDNNVPYEPEYRTIKPDGQIRYLISRGKVLRNELGKPVTLYGVLWDSTNEKEAKDAIENAAKVWHHTFNAIPDAIAVFTNFCQLVCVNKAMEDRYSKNGENIIGNYCWNVIHQTNHAVSDCPTQKALKSKKRETSIMKNGNRWEEITADPIFDSMGDVTGVVHILKDITDRKKIEEKEEKTKEQLNMLFLETINVTEMPFDCNIYESLADSLTKLLNKAVIIISSFHESNNTFIVEAIQGFDGNLQNVADLLGTNPVGLTLPLNEEVYHNLKEGKLHYVKNGLQQILMGQIPEAICKIIEKELQIQSCYSIGLARNNTLLGSAVILSVDDNLEMSVELIEIFMSNVATTLLRRRAEQRLRESEARYKSLIDCLPNMLLIHRNGRFLFANDILLKTVNLTASEILGRNVLDFIAPHHHDLALTNMKRRMKGEKVEEYELELNCNGIVKHVNLSSENIMLEDGAAVLVALSDVTERKKLEIENQRRYEVQNVINSILKLSQKELTINNILNQSFQLILTLKWLSLDDKGCIFLFNENTKELEMISQNNLDGKIIEKCKNVSLNQCLCGKAAATGQIQFADCLTHNHEVRYEGIVQHGNYCVPITLAEKTLGVINLYLKENHVENSFEKESLLSIANIIAGVIAQKNSETELANTMMNLEVKVDERTIELGRRNTDLLAKIAEVEQGRLELKISEEKLQITVEQAVDAIFMGDPKGNFIDVNSRACNLSGYTKGELLRMNMNQLFSDEVRGKIPLRYDLLNKGEIVIKERLLTRKDGTLVSVEMKTKKMPDGTYQAFMSDISKRKEAEKDMEAALRKEKELNLLKLRFISVLSHEFKTPLAGMQTSIELLERYGHKWDEVKRKEYFEQIYGSIRYTNSLLEDVSTYGKQESGNMKVTIKRFSFIKVMNSILHDVSSSFGDSVPVHVDMPKDFDIIETDESMMQHILGNIVSNAVKYSNQRNCVEVKISIIDEILHLIVKDFGIGIPEKDLEHIFEPFHRATNVDTIKGTGLGLSVVKNYVDCVRGEISIESTVDVGTTVFVKIPLGKKVLR